MSIAPFQVHSLRILPFQNSNGLCYRLCKLLLISSSITVQTTLTADIPENQPAWWTAEETRIIEPDKAPVNHAVVTLGQLMHVAQQARNHLAIMGETCPEINALIDSFVSYDASNPENDMAKFYGVANLGQLKAVAKLYYNKLLSIGYNTRGNLLRRGYASDWPYDLPWDPSTSDAENYALANLGQLKMVFSFELKGVVQADNDADSVDDHFDADPTNDGIHELSVNIISID